MKLTPEDFRLLKLTAFDAQGFFASPMYWRARLPPSKESSDRTYSLPVREFDFSWSKVEVVPDLLPYVTKVAIQQEGQDIVHVHILDFEMKYEGE